MSSHGRERTLRLARGANRAAQFQQSLVEMRTGWFTGSLDLQFWTRIEPTKLPLTRPSGTLSPSKGERDGGRGWGRLANERFRGAPEGCACFFLTRIFGDCEEAGEAGGPISVGH